MSLLERDFEADICQWLCASGGYEAGDPKNFDRQIALDTATLLRFVRQTQPKAWRLHEKKNPGNAETAFIQRFCKEVSNRSLLDVLRNGFKILGTHFRVIYWKPETGLNAETLALYNANILHCVRQLRYSPASENSIDIALLVNGIPIVAIELKNPLTGQNVDDAVQQYKKDRSQDDLFFSFKRRVLVCFAVDPSNVRMTTRLAGANTVFLPFDQGSNGPGRVGGAGNPSNEDDYPVAHLWKNILERDALIELLQRYLHLRTDEKIDPATGEISRKETMIFPRYHQWDVVRQLLTDAREKGAGHNYLIQHSAGSGKSNSIAWLAHRLSGLHDSENRKIFKSVIVVTDRRVLDTQLQDTIGQFEQTSGLVVKVKNSAQLRDAINDGKAIIVTTLQKFPVIFKEVEDEHSNFAIIVDEAHSSQTGQAALKLKGALADLDAALEEYAKMEGEAEAAEERKKDSIWQELAAHGHHHNLSFFAFTATPKAKTLELFGQELPDGRFGAWHIYSMRQAIEEHFILDVLKNYTTYTHYYKLLRKIKDDPRYATAAGMRAATRFETLHPHNIAQKTAVMLEHFHNVTMTKMGGRAKAMLMTASRLHAVRYMREFDRQIKENGWHDVAALVAFSGEVDDNGIKVTEPGLNEQIHGRKISEGQLPDAFAKDFNILIVAEKYQTGFDEPQLHTMFVDKPLSDVKAVQTLSRLNRIAPDKEDTFVLDFVNTAETIQKSFQPYYEATVLEEETEPNMLYDIKARLDAYKAYSQQDIIDIGKILSKTGKGQNLISTVINRLAPIIARIREFDEQKRLDFKTGLFRFVRLYGFITQIHRMFDKELHEYAFFLRQLGMLLPQEGDGPLDLEGQIDLEYYRLQKTGEGAIELESSEKGLVGIKGDAGAGTKKISPLSVIVEKINKRFGTQFKPEDQVHTLSQITDKVLASDARLVDLAREQDVATWNMVYDSAFPIAVTEAALDNAAFFEMLNTPEALEFLKMELKDQVLNRINTL